MKLLLDNSKEIYFGDKDYKNKTCNKKEDL
jgi:hypothetical protein